MLELLAVKTALHKRRARVLNNVRGALNLAKTLLGIQTPKATIVRSVMHQGGLDVREARATLRKARSLRRRFKHGGKAG